MKKSKPSKTTAKKAYQKAVGENKIIILDDIQKVETGWRVAYEENGKRYMDVFSDYWDAEEFVKQFGGDNIITVAAPMELLFFDNWDSEKLWDLGHVILRVSLQKTIFLNSAEPKTRTEVAPYSCGLAYLPGSRKKEEKLIFEEVIHPYAAQVKDKTIYFLKKNNIDSLRRWLKENFPDHRFTVQSFVSQHHEYMETCRWERKKVGDGTKRMELRMTHLNDVPYKDCRIRDIIRVADGMISKECLILKVPSSPKEQEHCGFYLGL